MNTYTATEPQKTFISGLLDARDVPVALAEEIGVLWHSMTKKEASAYIDALKALPYKPKVTFKDAEERVSPLQATLAELPVGKYAVPSYIIDNAVDEFVTHGDLVFFEVKVWHKPYLRNIVGSMGDFAKYKLSYNDSLAVAKVLASDPVGYIQKFGEVYTCCGKCGSPLTDEKSRALFLGPECRKMLGF